MSERWFRFYDGVPDDPKILKLPDKLFRAWNLFLCIANRYGGEIPKDMEDAAIILRLPQAKARALMVGLISALLFDESETGYTPHNWNGRQYKSDVSTDRVKQFRERQTKRQRNVSSAVSETPPEDRVQKTETEKTEQSAQPPAAPAPKPDRGTRWDQNREIPIEWIGDGEAKRAESKLAPVDLRLEAERFRNYWASKSGKDATKTKWHMTWMNWALNAKSQQINGFHRKESEHEKLERVTKEFIQERASDAGANRGARESPELELPTPGDEREPGEGMARNLLPRPRGPH